MLEPWVLQLHDFPKLIDKSLILFECFTLNQSDNIAQRVGLHTLNLGKELSRAYVLVRVNEDSLGFGRPKVPNEESRGLLATLGVL